MKNERRTWSVSVPLLPVRQLSIKTNALPLGHHYLLCQDYQPLRLRPLKLVWRLQIESSSIPALKSECNIPPFICYPRPSLLFLCYSSQSNSYYYPCWIQVATHNQVYNSSICSCTKLYRLPRGGSTRWRAFSHTYTWWRWKRSCGIIYSRRYDGRESSSPLKNSRNPANFKPLHHFIIIITVMYNSE
jgi:hypothetical protein